MTDVMISYSRRDGDFVRRLYAGLQERGRDVWVDWQDIPLSADWWQEIANAVEAADTFVFVVSPDSMGSPICNLEIAHARRNNKRLIPLLHRRTDLEDALDVLNERELSDNTSDVLGDRTIEQVARENWNAVSRHNWLYFEDPNTFDETLDRLVQVIETDLAHVKEHTRLLVRASEWEQRGRNNSFLLTGEEIQEAEDWLHGGMNKDPKPTNLHADYVGASRRAAEGRQRRLLVSVSVALVIAVMLMIVAGVLAVYANDQRQIADEQRNIAVTAQAEALVQADIAATNAANANSLLWASYAERILGSGDAPLALSLALAAVNLQEPPPLAQQTLAQVAFSPGAVARFAPTGLEGGSAEINDAVFSPVSGANRVALAMIDRRILLYNTATQSVVGAFTDFDAQVSALAFTPDGSAVLGASFNLLVLFDVETQTEQLRIEQPLGVNTTALAISPDGTQALSGANNGEIVLWDLTTGNQLVTLTGHDGEINDLAFSPDATRAISGSDDDRLILWNLDNGQVISRFERSSDVTSVAYHPDGSVIAMGSQLGELVIMNPNTGGVLQTFGGDVIRHQGQQAVVSLSFSPDGSALISGGDDSLAIVWQTSDGMPLYVFDAHDSAVTGVDFAPGGRATLTASSDGTLYLWSITADSVSQIFDGGHEEDVLAVSYRMDGSEVISADLNGTILRWEAATGSRIARYDGAVDTVNTLAFLGDDERFAVGGDDGSLLLEPVAITGTITTLTDVHEDSVTATTAYGQKNLLLSGDGDGKVALWNTESGELIRLLSDGMGEAGHTRDVVGMAFNANGTRALTGSADRTMILWDIETGTALQTFDHGGRILGVGFSPDEQFVYSGSSDDTIRIWNIATGEEVAQVFIGQENQERFTTAVTFHQGNNFALVGGVDGSVILWNMNSRSPITTYTHNVQAGGGTSHQVTALAFRVDGLAAVVGTRNQLVFEVRTLPLRNLIDWTRENRYIPELSCEERTTYNLPCDTPATVPE